MRLLMRVIAWGVGLAIAAFGLLIALSWAFTPAPPEPPETAGQVAYFSMSYEGRERHWIVYTPPKLAQPAPVVLGLPGSGQTAELLREGTNFGFEALADRDGFLVVYPEAWLEGGFSGPEWNECRKNTDLPAHRENVDDVGFILEVLARVEKTNRIDASRVYAVGVSDGGQMAYRLATEHPEQFGAIAAVVAQQAAPENSNCLAPRGPISVLVMNGTEDPIVPYGGGEAAVMGFFSAGQVQSIEGTAAHWKAVNAITGPSVRETLPDRDPDDGSTVVRERWASPDGFEVVIYSIVGGGHTIPGGHLPAPRFVVGATNRDISMAEEIWAFFQRHRRSPA